MAGDSWKCAVTPAEAQEATGAAVPDPTVPAGYALAYAPIIYVNPGPMIDAAYQRTWTPGGAFSARGASGPFIELRVHAHQPNGWGQLGDQELTLTNGVHAQATFSLSPKTYPGTSSAASLDALNEISWSHAGLDYDLLVTGLSTQEVVDVANSLP
jgi:hypothetical protein